MTRARHFADLVDRATGYWPPPRHWPRHRVPSRVDEDLSALVMFSERVTAQGRSIAPEPCPLFRANLRATLVAAAERDRVGAARPDQVRTDPATTDPAKDWVAVGRVLVRGRVRAAFVVGAATYALALASLPAGAADELPAEPPAGINGSSEPADLPSPARISALENPSAGSDDTTRPRGWAVTSPDPAPGSPTPQFGATLLPGACDGLLSEMPR